MIVVRNINSTDNLDLLYDTLYMDLVRHHSKLNPHYKEFIESNKDIKKIVLASMDSPYGYVAVDNGEYAGLLIGRKWRKDTVTMDDLYVKPKYRGRGVGKAMVSRFISDSRRFHIILLVLGENKAVIPFYERFGFRVVDNDAKPNAVISGYLMKRKREGR